MSKKMRAAALIAALSCTTAATAEVKPNLEKGKAAFGKPQERRSLRNG